MSEQKTERVYVLPSKLLQEVVNYLLSKPYSEVGTLMNNLTVLINNQNAEKDALAKGGDANPESKV